MNANYLVRFERSHCDDDELVAFKYGPYPGSPAYFDQLVAELAEGGFVGAKDMRLAHADMASHYEADVILLYAWIPARIGETAVDLARKLQHAYDDSGVAVFQVITGDGE